MKVKKHSILFVDDEPVMGIVGKEMMNELGYEITVFTDSIEAIKFFRRNSDEFDLVITDYNMPKMKGINWR